MPGIPDYIDPTLPFASESLAKKQQPLSDGMPEFDAWKKSQTPTTRSGLLRAVQPIIDGAVKGYGSDPLLGGQAKLMALQSFNSYDPAKGTLKNHIIGHLQGLKRQSGQNSQVIHIPERLVLEHQHLQYATNELENALGRPPSDAELSDRAGIPLKRIAQVRRAQPGTVESSLRDEQGGIYNPATKIPGQNRSADMWQTLVYHDLAPVDQFIMEHTLGLHGKAILANTAVAAKLRVSPGAISQRKAKIQAMLDERYDSALFDE